MSGKRVKHVRQPYFFALWDSGTGLGAGVVALVCSRGWLVLTSRSDRIKGTGRNTSEAPGAYRVIA